MRERGRCSPGRWCDVPGACWPRSVGVVTVPMRQRDEPVLPAAPPIGDVIVPPSDWPQPPPVAVVERRVPTRGRSAAVLVWLGGALAVCSVVLPWAHYRDGYDLEGVRHVNGWLCLAFGLLAAGLGGARWAGVRHVSVRLAMFAVGAALVITTVANRVAIGLEDARGTSGSVTPSYGLTLAFLGGLFAVVAAVVDDSPLRSTSVSAPPEPTAKV
jgi:hypothetical protein